MENKNVRKHALPNCNEAFISPEKLRDYVLDPSHETGKHKAAVFKSMLGFERKHWQELEKIIRTRLAEYPAHRNRITADGEKWIAHLPIVGLNGNLGIVTTTWYFKNSEPRVPILTSCYIQTRKQEKLKKMLGL